MSSPAALVSKLTSDLSSLLDQDGKQLSDAELMDLLSRIDEEFRSHSSLLPRSHTSSSSLLALRLSSNGFGPESARSLTQFLARWPLITELHVGGTRLGDDGLFFLADAFRSSKCSLVSFFAWGISAHDRGPAAIARALRGNSSLRRLELDRNSLSDIAATTIGEMLSENSVLEILNVEKNSIGPAGACSIAQGIAVSAHLTELRLADNALGDAGVIEFVTALSSVAGSAGRSSSVLSLLDFSGNHISDEAIEYVCQLFHSLPTLQQFHISRNRITQRGGIMLGDALRSNTSLTGLWIGGNTIGSVGAISLLDATRFPISALETLHMWRNGITDEISSSLVLALRESVHLRNVDLDRNELTNDLAEVLVQDLVDFPRISSTISLQLNRNRISSSRIDLIRNMLKTETSLSIRIENQNDKDSPHLDSSISTTVSNASSRAQHTSVSEDGLSIRTRSRRIVSSVLSESKHYFEEGNLSPIHANGSGPLSSSSSRPSLLASLLSEAAKNEEEIPIQSTRPSSIHSVHKDVIEIFANQGSGSGNLEETLGRRTPSSPPERAFHTSISSPLPSEGDASANLRSSPYPCDEDEFLSPVASVPVIDVSASGPIDSRRPRVSSLDIDESNFKISVSPPLRRDLPLLSPYSERSHINSPIRAYLHSRGNNKLDRQGIRMLRDWSEEVEARVADEMIVHSELIACVEKLSVENSNLENEVGSLRSRIAKFENELDSSIVSAVLDGGIDGSQIAHLKMEVHSKEEEIDALRREIKSIREEKEPKSHSFSSSSDVGGFDHDHDHSLSFMDLAASMANMLEFLHQLLEDRDVENSWLRREIEIKDAEIVQLREIIDHQSTALRSNAGNASASTRPVSKTGYLLPHHPNLSSTSPSHLNARDSRLSTRCSVDSSENSHLQVSETFRPLHAPSTSDSRGRDSSPSGPSTRSLNGKHRGVEDCHAGNRYNGSFSRSDAVIPDSSTFSSPTSLSSFDTHSSRAKMDTSAHDNETVFQSGKSRVQHRLEELARASSTLQSKFAALKADAAILSPAHRF